MSISKSKKIAWGVFFALIAIGATISVIKLNVKQKRQSRQLLEEKRQANEIVKIIADGREFGTSCNYIEFQ
jgi:enoyl-[acyl-carrier-protein] reductase (NADH)